VIVPMTCTIKWGDPCPLCPCARSLSQGMVLLLDGSEVVGGMASYCVTFSDSIYDEIYGSFFLWTHDSK
jgi:hypothetical protein